MNPEDLELIEKKVEEHSNSGETILHKAMKKWIAIEYYNKGISLDDIEIEKRFRYGTYSYTAPDVFINANGGIAIYCQMHNQYPWLYKFIEGALVEIKKHSKKQIIIFPENLEALFPTRWHYYLKELNKEKVEIISAPFHIDVDNKQNVQINMTYKALTKLVKIKNKFATNRSLVDFIEKDLENIIKTKKGFP